MKSYLNLKSCIIRFFIVFFVLSLVPQTFGLVGPDIPDERRSLNISLPEIPSLIDPHISNNIISTRIIRDLFEGLMIESPSGKITTGIAYKYFVSDDKKKYTFYIRKNAKFSDGSRIKASDVVFSFRRLVSPKTASMNAYLAEMILNSKEIINQKKSLSTLGVYALDDQTVEILLERPVSYFLNIISMTPFVIVKEKGVLNHPDFFEDTRNFISSAAYTLSQDYNTQKLSMVKNEHYWNTQNTMINHINFISIPSTTEELKKYQLGEVDITFNIPSNKISMLQQVVPEQVKIIPLLGTYYLNFNLNNKIFRNNRKLRQALSMAIDRELIVKEVLGRGEQVAFDIVHPRIEGYQSQIYDWSTLPQSIRLEEALKTYAAAGYSQSKPLTLHLLYNTSDQTQKKVIMAIASSWKTLFESEGLQIVLDAQDQKNYIMRKQFGAFEIAASGIIAEFNAIEIFSKLFQCDSKTNISKYCNNHYDTLQTQATNSSDLHSAFLQQSLKIALEDYPVIPVYYYTSTYLVKPYVNGFQTVNHLNNIYSKNLSFKKNANLVESNLP